MAMDGQVVFTVELEDTTFQSGLQRLKASLVTLSASVLAALRIGAAEFEAAFANGQRWVNSFASGVSRGAAITQAVTGVVRQAANAAMSEAYSGGYGVGRNIVEGIQSGAQSRSGSLGAALAAIVRRALAVARRAAGIHSPSRLFHDELGRYLALGIQSGFVNTMEDSVLPAINQSVSQSAQAGRATLSSTLLNRVNQLQSAAVTLPNTARLSTALLGGISTQANAARQTATGSGAVQVTQNITFENNIQAPHEVARAIRRQATYGLAAVRG